MMASLQMKELGVCISFCKPEETGVLPCSGPFERGQRQAFYLPLLAQLHFGIGECAVFLCFLKAKDNFPCDH